MKKSVICYRPFIAMMTGICMLLSSCGAERENTNIETTESEVATTAVETTTLSEATSVESTTIEVTTSEPMLSFEPCPYAELLFLDHDRKTESDFSELGIFPSDFASYIVCCKNNSDSPIMECTIAVMGFDENFLPENKEPVEYDDLIENIPANEYGFIQMFREVKEGKKIYGEYYTGTISHLSLRDGTEWNAENLDLWADEVYKNFSEDDWKKQRESLKAPALEAEHNEYLSSVTNISVSGALVTFDDPKELLEDTDIDMYAVLIVYYDKKGKNIGYGAYGVNSESFFREHNFLLSDTASEVTSDNLGYTKNIILQVKFKNGTEWENGTADIWRYYNEKDLILD